MDTRVHMFTQTHTYVHITIMTQSTISKHNITHCIVCITKTRQQERRGVNDERNVREDTSLLTNALNSEYRAIRRENSRIFVRSGHTYRRTETQIPGYVSCNKRSSN